jgi:hypothetical protein
MWHTLIKYMGIKKWVQAPFLYGDIVTLPKMVSDPNSSTNASLQRFIELNKQKCPEYSKK